MTDWITLTSPALTARINPLGAELSSLTDAAGRELMTDADPAFWTGRAPLLFPIVGRLAGDELRIDGQAYPMKQHGFARRMLFAVVEAADASATFRLVDTEETRAAYPFAFRLDVTYRLTGATLAIDVTIANPGDVPLPASFGFHPAFAWPLPSGAAKEAYRIVFAADEPAPIRAIEGGLLAGERASPLDDRTLPLSDALFADDALVWTGVRSQSVRYGADTGPSLEIAFPDTPDLGIWSKPGARFVCVEPWHGHADPVAFAGEFRDKPGVFEVAPGGEKRLGMRVTLHP
ncbi:aldose 1-epimerase family protein [Sphingomonas sp.]|uniref:aldose 1-epimerase family protein n=1 Tax=Sphingomonas sp. TaxID=28214 RepID=UPI0035C8148C